MSKINKQHELMHILYEKHHKALVDKLKIHILDALIKLSDTMKRDYIFKEEIIFIREGVEKERNKEKEKELDSIKEVIESLMGRFGK